MHFYFDLKTKIIKTLHEVIKKTAEWKETKDDNLFWKEVTNADSFLLNMMGNYSPKFHLPYKKYLEEREENENGRKKEFDELTNGNLDWLLNIDD